VAGLSPVFGTATVAKDGSFSEIGAAFFADAVQGQIDVSFFPPTAATGSGFGDRRKLPPRRRNALPFSVAEKRGERSTVTFAFPFLKSTFATAIGLPGGAPLLAGCRRVVQSGLLHSSYTAREPAGLLIVESAGSILIRLTVYPL
jgi:hypothetical protein